MRRRPAVPRLIRLWLQGAQKVQQVLLILHRKFLVGLHNSIRFGVRILAVAVAGMVENRVDEILRPTVVEKEETLPQSPERSGTKFISLGLTLDNVVGKASVPCDGAEDRSRGLPECCRAPQRQTGRW